MTESLAEFARNNGPLPAVPKGFEAVVETGHKNGTASNITLPEAVSADDAALLRGAGLDPDAWVVTPGTRRHKKWQRYDGEWLNWWSFTFEERTTESADERRIDVADMGAMFRRRAPRSAPPLGGTDAFAFLGTDWQIGKGEGGGTEAAVGRVREGIEKAVDFVKTERKTGRVKMPTGAFLGTGDLHEGCMGFYAMQEWQTDCDRRTQNKIVRRLMREAVEELAPLFDEFIVAGVGGNHGENRKEGKAFTTFADNDDVAAMEVLQEVLTDRPGFDHVKFFVPDDELAICFDLNGVSTALAHGHQFGGGSTAQKKAENWWAYQAFGQQPLAHAQVMFSGHYHHYSCNTYGCRTHFQGPSQDGGSLWFKNSKGVDSPTGQLVVVLDSTHPLGWTRSSVL